MRMPFQPCDDEGAIRNELLIMAFYVLKRFFNQGSSCPFSFQRFGDFCMQQIYLVAFLTVFNEAGMSLYGQLKTMSGFIVDQGYVLEQRIHRQQAGFAIKLLFGNILRSHVKLSICVIL